MSISSNKVRAGFVISKELKEKAEKLAYKENRSFSNLIVNLLQEYVDKHEKNDVK